MNMLHMAAPAIAPDVAIADTWTPSRRMQAAAAAERERVERELARLGVREDELAAELAAVQASRAELEHQRHVLSHFTHGHDATGTPGRVGRRLRALPDARSTTANGMTMLRGARIRETAVRVLADKTEPDAPVHYRDWFELLTAQGFMPTGKDPLATFLTQVGRSPVVRRTTTSGVYVLDLEFPERARERLTELAAAQSQTQELPAHATVEEIAAARERRAALSAEILDTERQLEEALRSLAIERA
jgi:hypothetical protein